MAFSAKQLKALRRNLDHRYVRTREAHGRELSYVEGWYAISEANRIFGFDGWSRETIESKCVLARENRGSFLAVYVARVRITVHADGATIIREGLATGMVRLQVRCTILRSKLRKPTRPSGRLPRLESLLG
jgi:recombination DNA repair RAD52 pathway protein